MKIGKDDYEPFVADHYRCTICGEDVHKDDTSDFDMNYATHYECAEHYDDDPDGDDPYYDDDEDDFR